MAKPPLRRALVADDEPMIGTLVREILSREGFQSDLATDGDAASRQLSAGGYDLAVLDLMMPGRGGADVLDQLRRAGASVPVVLMSSHIPDEVVARFGSDSGVAFLHKPFGLNDLLLAAQRASHP
jgi:DNA-binding response OmpR family regulator